MDEGPGRTGSDLPEKTLVKQKPKDEQHGRFPCSRAQALLAALEQAWFLCSQLRRILRRRSVFVHWRSEFKLHGLYALDKGR